MWRLAQIKGHLRRVMQSREEDELGERLAPKFAPLPNRLAGATKTTPAALTRRWSQLGCPSAQALLCDEHSRNFAENYAHNIENYIGNLRVPIGVAGPLRVNGIFAQGDFMVPLATTEAALVASYERGARVISAAGGCSAILLFEAVCRAPVLVCASLADAGRLMIWLCQQMEIFKKITSEKSRHAVLLDLGATIEGNHIYLNLDFTTGSASGQNMVTVCTAAICDFIAQNSPVPLREIFVEGNFSGDKKASAKAFSTTRGKKVSAEVVLPADLVQKKFHTSPAQMVKYWQISAIGGVLSGTIGVNGHFANGLAAFYLATGQDVACVAESAVGITRFELTDDGGLYAAVTLPALMLGTVGGGTALPTQNACLELLGLNGAGNSEALAEVCAALLLGGELSIIAALAAGHFAKAHDKLRKKI